MLHSHKLSPACFSLSSLNIPLRGHIHAAYTITQKCPNWAHCKLLVIISGKGREDLMVELRSVCHSGISVVSPSPFKSTQVLKTLPVILHQLKETIQAHGELQ